MIVLPATEADVRFVVTFMREADRREVYATRWTHEPDDLVADIELSRPMLIRLDALVADDGEPVALLGVWLKSPGVGTGLMLATDRWAEIAPAAHRYVRRRFLPLVCAPNLHRLECHAHVGHAVSRRWLARLGFLEEGVARAFGKSGEDYVHCAWFPPKGASSCVPG